MRELDDESKPMDENMYESACQERYRRVTELITSHAESMRKEAKEQELAELANESELQFDRASMYEEVRSSSPSQCISSQSRRPKPMQGTDWMCYRWYSLAADLRLSKLWMHQEMTERLKEAYNHEMLGRDQEYLKQARVYWEGHTQVVMTPLPHPNLTLLQLCAYFQGNIAIASIWLSNTQRAF